jgi:hypothetical protein
MPETAVLPANPGESVTVPTTATGQTSPATQPATPPATPPAPPVEDPLAVDIKAALAKARQDEKDKQYAALEKVRGEKKAAEAQLTQAQETIASLTKQLEKTAIPATPPPPKDSPEAIEKRLVAAAESVASAVLERAEKEIFGPKITALENQLADAKKQVERSELAAYRQTLIEANKGAIIPELVSGNSKQELDDALVTAKQSFARIAQSIQARQTVAVTTAGESLVPLPPTNAGGGSPQDQTPGPKVRGMSQSDYAKSREALLKDASEQARKALASLD